MPDVMKTLLLNPPSFENFDGGASSRWPATREIESYWYPVWLTYPAGMIPGSRLLDASPAQSQLAADRSKSARTTNSWCCSRPPSALKATSSFSAKSKKPIPSMKVAFVGPHGHIKPDETLNASEDIEFVTRGEFDHSVVEYAHGKPLERNRRRQLPQRRQDRPQRVASAASHRRTRRAALCHRHLQARPEDRKLQRPVSSAPLRFLLHVARLSGALHFLHVAADAFPATPGARVPRTTSCEEVETGARAISRR